VKEKTGTGAGALERENARFNFSLFPAPARFFPSMQSRCDCGGLCGGEKNRELQEK